MTLLEAHEEKDGRQDMEEVRIEKKGSVPAHCSAGRWGRAGLGVLTNPRWARGAGAYTLPGVSCSLGVLVLRFVFRMVKHHVDTGLIHVLKINIHAYFRRKTSGIQNVIFALKTYPTLASWEDGGCSPNPGPQQ